MKNKSNTFVRNTVIGVITKTLRLVLIIAGSIIIARTLGAEGKGIYSLSILLPGLLMNIGNIGIGQASVFYIGQRKYTPEEVFGNNIILASMLGLLGFCIGLVIVLFFNDLLLPGVKTTYLLLGLFLIPLNILFYILKYVILGLQKIKEFSCISIVQSLVFLCSLVIIVLVSRCGIMTVIMINIFSGLVGILALLHLTKKSTGDVKIRLSRSYLRDLFGYGGKIYLGTIIQFLHYRVDLFLINILMNPTAVGLYSIAVVLAERIIVVSQSAGAVLFARVCSETNERKLKIFTPVVCRNVLLVTIIGAVVLYFIGPSIIIFCFSPTFAASVMPFRILLVGVVCMGGWKILANDLCGRGKAKWNIYINGVSLVLNIVLNILLIPKYGIVGAAWATSLSYTFAFVAIAVVYGIMSGNTIATVVIPGARDCRFYVNLVKQ
ncbi:MAG: polysaccharide biosynthesis C-terminal domain-containing protein [Planctomycetota bacterium]|nr:polysaccharide biosynthesis C-terminal domain-containing protein [Planctomycetota bacterium]